jgi:hypothetical protein
LKFYKHVVKSRMQENNFFVVFKKSMQKHVFETLNICFFYKKKH